jgi:hypothetical protein
MIRIILIAAAAAMLNGCAGVTVTPLDLSGNETAGARGFRYFPPKPYLLVMEGPAVGGAAVQSNNGADTTQPVGPARQPGGPATPQPRAGGPRRAYPTPQDWQAFPVAGGPGGNAQSTNTAGSDGSGGTASTPADVTFSISSDPYLAKIIYLPDYEHPLAITEHTGFGTVQMQFSLVDGWMLNNFSNNANSEGPEMVTALASLLSAATSLTGPGAAKGAGGKGLTAGGVGQPQPTTPRLVLQPGLYEFRYSDGKLAGLCAITLVGRNVPSNSCLAPAIVSPTVGTASP